MKNARKWILFGVLWFSLLFGGLILIYHRVNYNPVIEPCFDCPVFESSK